MGNAQSSRARLVFIDVLRLVAAVQMIQGHSVSSVLAPSYRQGALYETWTFARGLTSVTFLFTAGLAFVLAEQRGHHPHARRARIRRAARLIALGYLLHAPLAVFFGAPLVETLRAALVVDVLQCIGVSLLSLELLALRLHTPARRALVAGMLGLGCFFSAPTVHALSLPALALPLTNYLGPRDGSLFPLLPWSGYVLCGFAVGSLAFAPDRSPARTLLLAALPALGAGFLLLKLAPGGPLGSSPGYALVKLGCVALLAALLAQATRGLVRLPRLLAQLAAETLFLYVSHVLVLYADLVGLERLLGARHGPWFGLALTLVLLLACSGLALVFRSLRPRARGGTRAAPSA